MHTTTRYAVLLPSISRSFGGWVVTYSNPVKPEKLDGIDAAERASPGNANPLHS